MPILGGFKVSGKKQEVIYIQNSSDSGDSLVARIYLRKLVKNGRKIFRNVVQGYGSGGNRNRSRFQESARSCTATKNQGDSRAFARSCSFVRILHACVFCVSALFVVWRKNLRQVLFCGFVFAWFMFFNRSFGRVFANVYPWARRGMAGYRHGLHRRAHRQFNSYLSCVYL